MEIWGCLLLLSMLAGVTSENLKQSIYRGRACADNERQYHVFVQSDDGGICGGSLLNNRWVITAAHCQDSRFWWMPKKPLTLRFGRTRHDPLYPQRPLATRVVPGENQFVFNINKGSHDIMLLKMDTPLDIRSIGGLSTIDLPPNPCQRPAIGKEIHMAGWGLLDKNKTYPRYPSVLQCAEMNVSKIYWSSRIGRKDYIANNDNTFGYTKHFVNRTDCVDTCPGDSGGGVEYNGRLHGVHVRGGIHVCIIAAEAADVCYQPIRNWIQYTMNNN